MTHEPIPFQFRDQRLELIPGHLPADKWVNYEGTEDTVLEFRMCHRFPEFVVISDKGVVGNLEKEGAYWVVYENPLRSRVVVGASSMKAENAMILYAQKYLEKQEKEKKNVEEDGREEACKAGT